MFLGLVTFSMSCSKDDGCTQQTFYLDNDKDGFGQTTKTKMACEKPAGYAEKSGDTDDGNTLDFPGCNEITFYFDKDDDGYGNPNATEIGCIDAPDGFVAQGGDCDDEDDQINPGVKITYYEDMDEDGFGVEDKTIQVSICDPAPEKYTDRDTGFDCDDNNKDVNPDSPFRYYEDADGDGYGNPIISIQALGCRDDVVGYVVNADDCDDTDPNINPESDEIAGDGIDNNCDDISGFIWDGPTIEFNKAANVDWTLAENQDELTKKVTFTRQNTGPMYNFEWWQTEFKADAVHVNSSDSDLHADFWDNENSTDRDFKFSGGTKGVRWALLDSTGGDLTNEGWATYPYATLGNPEGFYSFHNVVSIITALEDGFVVDGVVDDFNISLSGFPDFDDVDYEDLIGKKLGVWLVEDDIYLTLTFTEWASGQQGGGAFTYTRSTPNN
ncbi:putative metal-binding motif-containing protein [Flagellimonas sp. S3867]|uniref:putative metal-binding motif-containing protein n=1 Tax=Flagellimonas sp. S3867 TaxID=2768063 RepID=UPI001CC23BD6|nr:putative metal-binding motif-containing protein [Flagellimonas sp. S3867]